MIKGNVYQRIDNVNWTAVQYLKKSYEMLYYDGMFSTFKDHPI